jgi:hypothetical protein
MSASFHLESLNAVGLAVLSVFSESFVVHCCFHLSSHISTSLHLPLLYSSPFVHCADES